MTSPGVELLRKYKFIIVGRGEAFTELISECEQILAAAGRTSVDRSSKATLPLTVPGGAFKSSAKDLSVRPFVFAVELLLR